MKPITQNLIAAVAGGLAVAVLMLSIGRPWISDKRARNAEPEQEENNVRERAHACFDEQDISYEEIDSIATRFAYEDENYIFLYAPDEDDEFVRIWTDISYDPDISNEELYEKMYKILYIQEHTKFLKVRLDRGRCLFTMAVEQYIDPDMDISALLHRMIKVLSGSVSLFMADNDDYLLPDDGDTEETESGETIIGQ